jgi:tetratricopeptide repeat protein
LEEYRKREPQDKDKWAVALYTIYLNLNMGKEFEEIDKLLRK